MTKQRTRTNGKTMPTEEWLEIRDSLTLALDGIETGPLDFIGLRQCSLSARGIAKVIPTPGGDAMRTGPDKRIQELTEENRRLKAQLAGGEGLVPIRYLGETADWSPEQWAEFAEKSASPKNGRVK